MNSWRRILSLATFTLASLAASAAETIRNYQSRIEVSTDGSLFVTETITVTAEGARIIHGIYREFPKVYTDQRGLRRTVTFTVAAIERDGHAEPWHSDNGSNGIRIYIGSASTNVPVGEHTYVIKYKTERQLGFFPDHDELYWNVTGNGWVFPLEKVSAEVILPEAAQVSRIEAYTGPQGYRGRDYTGDIDRRRPNVANFASTKRLSGGSGMTIVVGWPVGIVTRPTASEKFAEFLEANAPFIVSFTALLGALGYYLWAWNHVGRDPATGTIIPLYAPPDGFSPAAVRYVRRMGIDQRCFAANLISLAVKGYLRIAESGKEVSVTELPGTAPLFPDEKAMHEKLFSESSTFHFNSEHNSGYAAALHAVQWKLSTALKATHFSKHTGYLLLGFPPAFIAVAAAALNHESVGALFWLLFVVPATLAMLIVFARLLRAPTVLGRKRLDEIEGFKRYLSVAEKDRLNLENPPKQTPELFDQFLPYALALGVEQEWSEQFAAALRAAERDPNVHYQPAWYMGNQYSPSRMGSFGSAIASSVVGAISSAATAPGSSSGFSSGGGGGGGGGSSGGGGGGGGGGGW